MKAVRLLEYGGQLVFNDVPTPTIARDEILVKVKSTAVNHLDLVKASGAARQILPIDLPWIPGHEFSGVVEQIGSDVAGWAPGDAVFGASGTGAAYAEYLASTRRPSQGNHPTSPLRRRHQCRWPHKLRGRESSPTVTWKRDKRS
jgi:NADPH:quinone reductase-like Zn-dependent oxidoreductase